MTSRSFEQNRSFGDSRLLGTREEGADQALILQSFLNLSEEEQAEALGWSAACPVVADLIQPEELGGRGAREMRNKYGQVVFWFEHIRSVATESGNEQLAFLLSHKQPRLANEPVGYFNDVSIPVEHIANIFRSPAADALPRILLTFSKKDVNGVAASAIHPDKVNTDPTQIEKNQDNLTTVLDLLDELIPVSNTPNELAVLLVENLFEILEQEGDIKTQMQLLRNLLGASKHNEENCHHAYRQLFHIIHGRAPRILALYQSLNRRRLVQYDIVDIQDLPDELPQLVLEQPIQAEYDDFRNLKIHHELQFSIDEIFRIKNVYDYIVTTFQEQLTDNHASWQQDYFSQIHKINVLGLNNLTNRKETLERLYNCLTITDQFELDLWDEEQTSQTAALTEIRNELVTLLEDLDLYDFE